MFLISSKKKLKTFILCVNLLVPLLMTQNIFAQNNATNSTTSEKSDIILQKMTVKSYQDEGTRIIPTDVLQRTMAKDMADVFITEPSVNIGGGARNAQRIYIRGIEGSNLNISVDGAKQNLNMHQHRGGIGSIEPNLLKRVEVHPGPGSDQGPGALGGSIKFETKDAQDFMDPDEQAGATLRWGFSSTDDSMSGSSTAYAQHENFGIFAHAAGSEGSNYRAGGGDTMPNTAADDRDYMVKFSMLDLADHSLRLSAEHSSSEGLYLWGSTGSDNGIAPDGSTPVRQVMERNTFVFDHRYDPMSDLIDTKFNLYQSDNLLENETSDTEYKSTQYGGDVRNTFRFETGPLSHALTAGVDYLSETGTAKRTFGADTGKSIDSESKNLGVFLQNRASFWKLGLSAGARYDRFEAEYGTNTFSGDEISPSVGADFEIITGLTAFTNYGEAVRGSGLIPVGWMANIYEGTNINDGKDLKPEKSRQLEGGLRYERSALLLDSDNFSLEGSLFKTELEDTIERVGGGGGAVTKIWNNPDMLTSKGWELRAMWSIPNYDTTIGLTHVKTVDEDGEPIAISRRKGAPTGDRLVWDNRWSPVQNIILGYTLTALRGLHDVADGEEERQGYVLHDIQAEWFPEKIQNLSFAVAVHNLLDKKYSEQTSIIGGDEILLEPGRDVRLGVTFKF